MTCAELCQDCRVFLWQGLCELAVHRWGKVVVYRLYLVVPNDMPDRSMVHRAVRGSPPRFSPDLPADREGRGCVGKLGFHSGPYKLERGKILHTQLVMEGGERGLFIKGPSLLGLFAVILVHKFGFEESLGFV